MKRLSTWSSIFLLLLLVGFTHVDVHSHSASASVAHLQTTPAILGGTASQSDRTNLPVATVTSFIPLADANEVSSTATMDSMSVTLTSEIGQTQATYQTQRNNPLNDLLLNLVNPADLALIPKDELKQAIERFNAQQLTDVTVSLDLVAPMRSGGMPSPVPPMETPALQGEVADPTPVPQLATSAPVLDSVILSDLTADDLAPLDPLVWATILKNRLFEDVLVIVSGLPFDAQTAILLKINADFVSDLPTPSPQPSPTRAPTNTPVPTAIPLPTTTFTPTAIIPPSATFTVTDRPLPTNTNVPTVFIPTATFTLTARPLPTSTVRPTQVVLTPTYTVSPPFQPSRTFTPSPIPPPTATRTPTLVPTPSPTRSS